MSYPLGVRPDKSSGAGAPLVTLRPRCVVAIMLRRMRVSGDWLCFFPSDPGAEPHHLHQVLVGELSRFFMALAFRFLGIPQFFC